MNQVYKPHRTVVYKGIISNVILGVSVVCLTYA